jgi:uncharacterized protein
MSAWLTNWPWWLGSVGFAAIVLGYWKLMGSPLGASASYARVMDTSRDLENAKREVALADPNALEASLRAATEAEFGQVSDAAGSAPSATRAQLLPWSAHLTFLIALVAGGFIASLLRNGHVARADLGPKFAHLFGQGLGAGAVLVGAGVLIGMGTRMGGGCSSGHGLSGCARFQPGSLVGTAAFFGTAVVVSLLLERFG